MVHQRRNSKNIWLRTFFFFFYMSCTKQHRLRLLDMQVRVTCGAKTLKLIALVHSPNSRSKYRIGFSIDWHPTLYKSISIFDVSKKGRRVLSYQIFFPVRVNAHQGWCNSYLYNSKRLVDDSSTTGIIQLDVTANWFLLTRHARRHC
jgi:hypothetical protein